MAAPVKPLTQLSTTLPTPMKHVLEFIVAAAPLSALPPPSSSHSSISTLAEIR